MSETTYYKRNRDVILNRADKYCENNKEVLREEAKKKYRELSEEGKNIKRFNNVCYVLGYILLNP